MARNAQSRGVDHYLTRLTERDIRYIRTAYKEGLLTQVQLARKYSLTQSSISGIVHNRTWSHIL